MGAIAWAPMRSDAVILLVLLGAAVPGASRAQSPASTTPKITGYLQGRFQSLGDSALFLLRRVRLGAQGNLTPWASYKVQAELRSGGTGATAATVAARSEEHTSELQSHHDLVCRL